MATYKVIQDIEAEDKFVGPLTLKQFIFFAGGALFGYLNIFALTKGATWALAIFAPPMLLGFFLAIPWTKDQPTEVWVLAKLRFRWKPKKKLWDQSGMEELVTITVPKKEERVLTNNLSQTEVRSRLKALAETIDTRGWAIKHAEADPGFEVETTDRLVDPAVLPQEVPAIDLATIPDVYDDSVAVSTNFDSMIKQSSDSRLKQNLEKMDRIRKGELLESIKQPEIHFTPPPTNYQAPVVPVSGDEKTISAQLKAKKAVSGIATGHMHTLNPASPFAADPQQQTVLDNPANDTPNQADNSKAQASSPTPSDPAILDLANNDDLDVATIARQAKKASSDDNEVVISLR